jgi:hypothetical protein
MFSLPDPSFSSRFYPYVADERQRDFYDLPGFNWRGNYDQGLVMNWGGGYQHGSNCGDRQQATIQFVPVISRFFTDFLYSLN